MCFTFYPCLRNDPIWLYLTTIAQMGGNQPLIFSMIYFLGQIVVRLHPCPLHILIILVEDFPFFAKNMSSVGLETNHQPVQLTKGRHIHWLWGHRLGKRIGNRSAKFAPNLGRPFRSRWVSPGVPFSAAKMWSSERATKIVSKNQQTNSNIELNYIPDGPCREYLPTFPLAIFHPNVGE